ncbi:MAG TPA: hypothetical protein VMZ30_15060 [Pyrinomonadaceae bacterium]|nr:hypothetical protein [Pyrinomonadaceae bacterium]
MSQEEAPRGAGTGVADAEVSLRTDRSLFLPYAGKAHEQRIHVIIVRDYGAGVSDKALIIDSDSRIREKVESGTVPRSEV